MEFGDAITPPKVYQFMCPQPALPVFSMPHGPDHHGKLSAIFQAPSKQCLRFGPDLALQYELWNLPGDLLPVEAHLHLPAERLALARFPGYVGNKLLVCVPREFPLHFFNCKKRHSFQLALRHPAPTLDLAFQVLLDGDLVGFLNLLCW